LEEQELATRELAPLQWSKIFRTLQIMELSGEILSGYFFEGVPGLQFISQRGFVHFKRVFRRMRSTGSVPPILHLPADWDFPFRDSRRAWYPITSFIMEAG